MSAIFPFFTYCYLKFLLCQLTVNQHSPALVMFRAKTAGSPSFQSYAKLTDCWLHLFTYLFIMYRHENGIDLILTLCKKANRRISKNVELWLLAPFVQ